MISRRAVLGTSAGVVILAGAAVAGDRTHTLDDLARAVGLEPRRRPARSDELLVRRVRKDQTALLLLTQDVANRQRELAPRLAPLVANVRAQLHDLGGPAPEVDPASAPATARDAVESLITTYRRAERDRARESVEAVANEFAQVLASISAGLAQGGAVLNAIGRSLA